jgi:glutamate/tyrosine decarboxylase-like PLP-dependent enzyme
MVRIPEHGIEKAKVLEMLRKFGAEDANYRENRTWSLVYYLGEEHTDFLKQAYGMYFSENGLNPMAFKSLKRMETEVVKMASGLLNGDEKTVGVMTSGGTESCLLPVVTYREMAKARRRLPIRPEMIAPKSIHVAWTKAAKYFGVKMVYAPLRDDFRVDVDAVRKLINRNTIMLVGSAPSYPHGVIDPLEELGRLALERNLPLHVDSCLGGFLLPFVEKIGYPVDAFDFRVPGVTSISADLHKYGFTAKGASILLYKNMDYMKHQFFIQTDWPGGVFASPAMLGTRPGGAVAAAWATLNALGMDGYKKIASDIIDATEKIRTGIESIPGLKVLGRPVMSVFCYTSTDKGVDIFAVGDQLEEKGWLVDRLQHPDAIHCMVNPRHLMVVDSYLADVAEAVKHVRANPDLAIKGNAAMYGMIANVPFKGIITNEVMKMMEGLYGPECKMPSLETDPSKQKLLDKAVPYILKMIKRFKKQAD